MTRSEPGWELYRTFLDVMRDGSLSGAGRRLGLTQPTAGRHIDALEAALGVLLFTRSQRGLLPTAVAHELLPHVEAMAAANSALLRTASAESDDVRGSVRLTTSEIIGCEVLPGLLADFCARYRDIQIELSVTNNAQNLLRRDADIAIRMIKPKQIALVARRIGAIRIGLFAHRGYIGRFGIPASLEDIRNHRLIGFDRDDLSFRSVGAKPLPLAREDFGFRCDSDIAQIAAIRAGVGIGACPLAVAEHASDLVRVLPDRVSFKLDMWLAMHENLRSTRRVRLFFDYLAERLSQFVRRQKGG